MAFLSSNNYRILRPLGSHTVPATCEEVDCQNYLNGWRIPLTVMTEKHFEDIRRGGWKFTVVRLGEHEGYVEFEAGQNCFARHMKQRERDPIWMRNNYRHRGVDSWHDDFATNQDRLNRIIEKG